MWKKTLLLMGLIMVMVAQVDAQSIGIGPQVGYYKVRDADQGNIMGGLALRVKLLPAIGVEGSINYRHEKYWDGHVTVHSWPVMVTGLFYPLPFVYGAMGVGWYNTTIDYDQNKLPLFKDPKDETKQKIGWHFGGGVELPVGPSFKLTADIRYVFLNYDFKTVTKHDNPNSNFYVITVGLLFGR